VVNLLIGEKCIFLQTVIHLAHFVPNGNSHTLSNNDSELIAFVKSLWRRVGCRLSAASQKDGINASQSRSLV
jgi:hypothetical protein